MAWSGGLYTKGNNATGGWVGDASLGIGIEAGRHDTQDNDFATGINQCINKDGSNAFTGNANLNNNKVTNVGAATARTDAPQVAQVQDGDFIWLGTTGGTATAQTVTASPAITAYKAGQKFRMKIGAGLGSTGSTATAHTLNVNSVGAKNLVNNEDGTNPTLGTWVAGAIMEVIYDGTNFVITNDPGGWLTYTPSLASTSGGSIASTTLFVSRYRKRGKMVTLSVYHTFTTTSVGATITVSTPVNIGTTGTYDVIFPIRNVFGGNNRIGMALNESTFDRFVVYVDVSLTAWGSNASTYNFNFTYPSV